MAAVIRRLLYMAIAACALLLMGAREASARIVRIEIVWRGPAYDGRRFGAVGQYETIVGRA